MRMTNVPSRFMLYIWRRLVRRDLLIGRRCEIRDVGSLHLGSRVQIGCYVTIDARVTLGAQTDIGDHVFIDSDVEIGANCSIGRLTSLMTKTHREQRGSQSRRSGLIVPIGRLHIGDNVIVGTRVLVLPQVRQIGAGTRILDGSVVTKDLFENEIVSGMPATSFMGQETTTL